MTGHELANEKLTAETNRWRSRFLLLVAPDTVLNAQEFHELGLPEARRGRRRFGKRPR